MIDAFFLIGLPYLSLTLMAVGSIYRFKSKTFTYSSLSSQFLESKLLLGGTIPWHIGIGIIFIGHIIVLFIPSLWHTLTANKSFLIFIESIGITCSILCIIGLLILLFRRVTDRKIQAVTTSIDIVILLLLLLQIGFGMSIAIGYRWGSAWATGTLTPYIWSIITFTPDMAYVDQMPGLIKTHIIFACIIFALVPFSRLVHIFSFPFKYIVRPPQKVIWTNGNIFEGHTKTYSVSEERRHFMQATLGLAAGGAILSADALFHISRYLKGPTMSPSQEQEVLAKKLKRLEQTADEKRLELERMTNDFIFVAKMSEITNDKGKYFIDYTMAPALAFLGKNNLPILISAKCTHLGCTVSNQMDKDGRILCPCHISYFNVITGMPNDGAPAKAPLPHLGWVLKDDKGKIILAQDPQGKLEGEIPDINTLKLANIFIAKRYTKENA